MEISNEETPAKPPRNSTSQTIIADKMLAATPKEIELEKEAENGQHEDIKKNDEKEKDDKKEENGEKEKNEQNGQIEKNIQESTVDTVKSENDTTIENKAAEEMMKNTEGCVAIKPAIKNAEGEKNAKKKSKTAEETDGIQDNTGQKKRHTKIWSKLFR